MITEKTIKIFKDQLTVFHSHRGFLTAAIDDLDHLVKLCTEFVELNTPPEEINP